MATAFALTIDGVLAEQGNESSFAASKLLTEGVLLYHGLASVGHVTLISLQSRGDADKVEYWLRVHGLTKHGHVIYDPHPGDPDRGISEIVTSLRKSGPLDLVVEGAPERAARWLHFGVPTTVLAVPSYTRSEFHPGTRVPTSWDALVAELDQQAETQSEDPRVIDEGGVIDTELST